MHMQPSVRKKRSEFGVAVQLMEARRQECLGPGVITSYTNTSALEKAGQPGKALKFLPEMLLARLVPNMICGSLRYAMAWGGSKGLNSARCDHLHAIFTACVKPGLAALAFIHSG